MSDEALELLKENIEALRENTEVLKHQDEPKMLFVKDVARIMGINVSQAGKLWDREDFPRNKNWTKKSRTNSILEMDTRRENLE